MGPSLLARLPEGLGAASHELCSKDYGLCEFPGLSEHVRDPSKQGVSRAIQVRGSQGWEG